MTTPAKHRRAAVVLCAVLLAVFSVYVRICYLTSFEPVLGGDEPDYRSVMMQILDRGELRSTLRLPGYPLLWAASALLFGRDNDRALVLIQACLGVLTCLLLFGAVRNLTSSAGLGLLAGVLYNCWNGVWLEMVLMTEAFTLFLVALLCFALSCAGDGRRRHERVWVMGGVPAIVVLLFLTRPEYAYLPILLAVPLFAWFRARKGLRGALLCCALLVLPNLVLSRVWVNWCERQLGLSAMTEMQPLNLFSRIYGVEMVSMIPDAHADVRSAIDSRPFDAFYNPYPLVFEVIGVVGHGPLSDAIVATIRSNPVTYLLRSANYLRWAATRFTRAGRYPSVGPLKDAGYVRPQVDEFLPDIAVFALIVAGVWCVVAGSERARVAALIVFYLYIVLILTLSSPAMALLRTGAHQAIPLLALTMVAVHAGARAVLRAGDWLRRSVRHGNLARCWAALPAPARLWALVAVLLVLPGALTGYRFLRLRPYVSDAPGGLPTAWTGLQVRPVGDSHRFAPLPLERDSTHRRSWAAWGLVPRTERVNLTVTADRSGTIDEAVLDGSRVILARTPAPASPDLPDATEGALDLYVSSGPVSAKPALPNDFQLTARGGRLPRILSVRAEPADEALAGAATTLAGSWYWRGGPQIDEADDPLWQPLLAQVLQDASRSVIYEFSFVPAGEYAVYARLEQSFDGPMTLWRGDQCLGTHPTRRIAGTDLHYWDVSWPTFGYGSHVTFEWSAGDAPVFRHSWLVSRSLGDATVWSSLAAVVIVVALCMLAVGGLAALVLAGPRLLPWAALALGLVCAANLLLLGESWFVHVRPGLHVLAAAMACLSALIFLWARCRMRDGALACLDPGAGIEESMEQRR